MTTYLKLPIYIRLENHIHTLCESGYISSEGLLRNESKFPSYSMIHSLSNGFNIVMYSCTHRSVNSNVIIHQSNGLRLT